MIIAVSIKHWSVCLSYLEWKMATRGILKTFLVLCCTLLESCYGSLKLYCVYFHTSSIIYVYNFGHSLQGTGSGIEVFCRES